MSAVRQLRSFKSGKSAPCDQIVDLPQAVQRCRTLLSSMDATGEFHNDRETPASIVDKLPAAAQERWFQRRPPSDESQVQKSIFLVGWLEEERKAAVAVHLNNLARQHTLPSGGMPKASDKTSASSNKVETTDQGLMSGIYAVHRLVLSLASRRFDAGAHEIFKFRAVGRRIRRRKRRMRRRMRRTRRRRRRRRRRKREILPELCRQIRGDFTLVYST